MPGKDKTAEIAGNSAWGETGVGQQRGTEDAGYNLNAAG
jgi:hypothetical protein